MKKIIKSRISLLLFIFIAIFSSLAVIPCCRKDHEKTGSVTIGDLHTEGSALIFIAKDLGFFEQNGINVKIRDYDSGLNAVNGLLDHDIDIAVTAEYPLAGSAFKKEKIKTIACLDKSELEYLVARQDHGINNISDLKGKRIGLPRGTISEFYLGRFLSLHSMNWSDVKIVDRNLLHSATSLLNGEIDAIVNWQPFADSVKDSLGNNAVIWPAQNNQPLFGIMTCRDDWITGNSGIINRVLMSLARAENICVNQPAIAKGIIKKSMNFSDKYMETSWRQNLFYLSLDQSLVLALEDEARWMIKNKLTSEKNVPNFLDYIYLDGMVKVKPDAVDVIR